MSVKTLNTVILQQNKLFILLCSHCKDLDWVWFAYNFIRNSPDVGLLSFLVIRSYNTGNSCCRILLHSNLSSSGALAYVKFTSTAILISTKKCSKIYLDRDL